MVRYRDISLPYNKQWPPRQIVKAPLGADIHHKRGCNTCGWNVWNNRRDGYHVCARQDFLQCGTAPVGNHWSECPLWEKPRPTSAQLMQRRQQAIDDYIEYNRELFSNMREKIEYIIFAAAWFLILMLFIAGSK